MQTLTLLCLACICAAVLAIDVKKYCLPPAVQVSVNGEKTVTIRGKPNVTKYTVKVYLDQTKRRGRNDINLEDEGRTSVSNVIVYQKTETEGYIYSRFNTACACMKMPEVVISACAQGNATKQGDLIRLDISFNQTHDSTQVVGNSSELVQPLSGEEGLFLSIVGASESKKDGKTFAHSSMSEKYSEYVQKVDDSDFVVPKEWNCPPESECTPTDTKFIMSSSLHYQEFMAQRK